MQFWFFLSDASLPIWGSVWDSSHNGHVQAASILASGVQDLADAAVIVSGATGVNLVHLGQLSVCGQVLHVVVAGVGPLCSEADFSPALKSED